MANETIYQDGVELILETAASSASISDGTFRECDSDDRQPSDSAGFPEARFELDIASGGFSTTPTAGAVFNLYEMTINSDSVDARDVSANNRNKYIGSFIPDLVDGVVQNMLIGPLTVNKTGGKYWLEWVDGGGGSASVDAGWELRMILTTLGTS